MKKVVFVLVFILVVFAFSACGDIGNGEPEVFSTADEAYDAMKEAIEKEDYGAAINYYNSGASDVSDIDVSNWYFYAVAMDEYTNHGCIGYPLDLLMNRIENDFEPAQTAIGELLPVVKILNGAYELDNMYLYILDGKIAISGEGQLTDMYFCNSEVAYVDGTYYWSERGQDGSHELKYTIEIDDNSVILVGTEENSQAIYEGTYVISPAEFPILYY